MPNYSKLLGILIDKVLGKRPQTWLADESKVDKSTLNRIIKGERDATVPELIVISAALGRDPGYFLRQIQGGASSRAELIADIVTALPTLNEDQLGIVLTTIERSIDISNTISAKPRAR